MTNNKKLPLGEFLKQARLEVGFSQKEISDKLGYKTPQFVSNWERNLTTPPGRTLRKLAQIYKIPPATLYEVLLEYVLKKTEEELELEFFGRKRGA